MSLLNTIWNLINRMFRIVGKVRTNKNLLVFIGFVALSSALWFLNTLRKDYTTTISFPVHFINLPAEKLIEESVPHEIHLKVRGTGYSLLRYRLSSNFYPFPIDVKKMKRFKSSFRRGAFIVSDEYKNEIVNQLSNDVDLLEISPDTLYIGLVNKRIRQVPVRLRSSLSFIQQYYQSGPVKIEPESVSVSGPESVIDTLSCIYTQVVNYENIGDSIVTVVSLIPYDQIDYGIKKVKVTIPVEPFTESLLEVPIVLRGIPPGMRVKTFPSDIQVSFRVAVSHFEKVKPTQFMAVVDLSGVEIEKQTRFKVRLEKMPDYIYAVEYSPLFVEFFIEHVY